MVPSEYCIIYYLSVRCFLHKPRKMSTSFGISFQIFSFAFLTTMAASSSEISAISEGNAKFTNIIYNLMRERPGNIFFSPISIQAVLALAHAGAGGNTASQVQTFANLPETKEKSSEVFGKLIDLLGSNEDVTLNLANALFADKQFEIKPDYLSIVQKGFKSELGQVNFAEGEAAGNTINSWVAQKTNNKIPQLFDSGSLTAVTKLVLLNAIYFKGNWLNKFPAKDTKKGVFHLNEKDTKEVDFMTLKEKFRVSENEDSYIVELPYKGEEVSMVLAVPKNITGLAAVEQRIQDADLNQLLKESRKREIILTMPKFKLEMTVELNDVLKKLGITDLFDEKTADLSGIANAPLFVSKAVQKAFIEVNEEGSEAAAATGMKIQMRMMPPPPIVITISSPFLFHIRHNDVTLFAGRVFDPSIQ